MFLPIFHTGEIDNLFRIDPYHPPTSYLFLFSFFFSYPQPHLHHFSPKFFKADFSRLSRTLESIDWGREFTGDDINNVCKHFYVVLNQAIDLCVPSVLRKPSKYPQWYNSGITKLLSLKNKYRLLFKPRMIIITRHYSLISENVLTPSFPLITNHTSRGLRSPCAQTRSPFGLLLILSVSRRDFRALFNMRVPHSRILLT